MVNLAHISQINPNLAETDKRKHAGPISEIYQFFSGLIWRLIFMKSIGDTNEAYVESNRGFCKRCFGCGKYNKKNIKKKRLKNIWDKLDSAPIAPYLPYNTSQKMQSKWRYYETNELHHRDIFRSMDRIKLIYSMLTESMNIFSITNPKYKIINSFGALHEIHELNNEPKMPLFNKMPRIMEATGIPDYLEKLFQFMASLKDEAEDRDFQDESLHKITKSPFFSPRELDIDPI